MENYERTMQLIEIAQDSAGRSSEQFAKYADSVANKVNRLKNTWEQFRINLVDEKTYKKLLDFANQALAKFSKVKLPQIAGITVWGMTIGRNLINNIIEGFRSGSNALSLGFESIITKLKTGNTRIEIQTNIDQIKNVDIPAVQQKIEELRNKPIQLHVPSESETRLFGIESSLNKLGYTLDKTRTDLNLFDLTSETASQDLRKLFDQYNFGTAAYYALDNAIRENRKEIEQHDQAVVNEQRHLEGLNAQIQNYQNQLIKSKNLSMVGNAIGSAMGTAATMAFTGTFDAEQIATSVGIQFATTGISTFTNAISSALAGTASFAAAGGPAGLIISVLSLLATFVLPKLISAIKKIQEARRLENDRTYATEKEYDKLKEKSDALAESLDNQKKKYEELADKQKNIKEAQSTFEELSSKIILTEDEQEKLNEATAQLAEQFPQLISYYDAQGNAVITINDNYKKLLKSQEESYLWEKKKTELATVKKISADYDTNEAEYKKLIEKVNDFYIHPVEEMTNGEFRRQTEEDKQTFTLDSNLRTIFYDLFDVGDAATSEFEEQGKAFVETIKTLSENYNDLTVDILLKNFNIREDIWNLIRNNRDAFFKNYKEIYSKTILSSEELDIYTNFDKEQQELLQDLINVVKSNFETAIDEATLSSGIEDKSFVKTLLLNNFSLDKDIIQDFKEKVKEDNISETDWLNSIINTTGIKRYINELNTKITPELKEKIQYFYDNLKALTEEERQKIISEIPTGQVKRQLDKQSKQIQNEIEEQALKIKKKVGLAGTQTLEGLSLEVIQGLAKKLEEDFDFEEAGEDAGKKYTLAFEEVILKYNLSEAAKTWLLSIDWQNMDWIHLESQLKSKAEEMVRNGFASTEKDAYKILKNLIEKVGETNLRIVTDFTTVGNVEALTETANNAFELLQNEMDNLTPVFRIGLEADEAKLTQEEYDKFTKALKTLMSKKDSPWAGLFDISKYTDYKDGKVFLTNLKELREILFGKDGPIAGLDELKKKRDDLQKDKDAGKIIDTEMFYAINDAIDSFEEFEKYQKQFVNDAKKAVTTFRDIEKAISSIASDYQSIVSEQEDKGFLSSKSLEGFLSNIETLNESLEGTDLANKKLDVNSVLTRNEKGFQVSTAALRNYIIALIQATAATDGLSEEDEHLHQRLQAILDDLNAFELERLKKAQEEAIEAAKAKEEELQKAAEDAKKAMEDAEKAAEDAQKDADEAKEKIKEAEKALQDAQDKVKEKYKDIEEKQKKVIELQDKLNELLYGTGDKRKSTLDGLYNYEQRLSAISNSLEDVKNSLEDINNVDITGSVYEYGALMHSKKVTLMSQQGVYSNNLAAIKTEISPYTEYFTEVNGRLLADVAKINAAQMNDKYKDWLESQISAYNDSVDKIHSIKNELISIEKEFANFQKTYRDKYISLQETVISTLKEEAQEEINITKEKYAAMEEADNDYVNALEEAIRKQRELRQLQQDQDDLAQKEKKLSLLRRDTSGTRQKDVLKQQKDVEKSRQNLVDKNVDNIIKNLKDLYKNQKDARDAEIKYQEEVLKNATYIEEANAIIQSWGTADEMIGWFIDHNQKTQEMTAEQLEKYSEELTEMYNAREIYMTTSMKDFSKMLNVQQDEINKVTTETAEHLTSESHRSLEEIREEVEKAIEDAKKELEEAMEALRTAKNELIGLLDDVSKELDKVKTAQLQAAEAANLAAAANRNLAASKDELMRAESAAAEATANRESVEQSPTTTTSNSGSGSYSYVSNSGVIRTVPTNTNTSSLSNTLAEVAQVASSVSTVVGSNSNTSIQRTSSVQNTDFNQGKMAEYESDIIKQIKAARTNSLISQLSAMNLNGVWDKKNKKFIWTNSFSSAQSYINNKPLSERGGLVAFAKGGLVNYTGPAWVDGTPAQPEAFLSAEDTRNIAHFTDVLSSLYNSFGQFNPAVSTSSETTINVTVNVDGVSSDYDVDRAVERVKQSIIDAANQTGSTVILHQ